MVSMHKMLGRMGLACGLLVASDTVVAQSSDGYHSILVFPVVVDTASFTQRFTIDNPYGSAVNVSAKFFPAVGTTQAAPLACDSQSVPAGQSKTLSSLRSLCPGLASGSQFGFLYLWETETRSAPFAAYSRVSNPQGNGFSVESFPANNFSFLASNVIGLRRLASGPGTPAFQTNCFIGGINDVTARVKTSASTVVTLYSATGVQIGNQTPVAVEPGKITRILDVFAFVGAPAGDYDNVTAKFYHPQEDAAGLLNFCTVQDNTSFGADFRIAKPIPFDSGDSLLARDISRDVAIQTSVGQVAFKLLPDGARHNTHVVYFRHPDYVQCEVIDPGTGVRALPGYGLEMRLMDSEGLTVLAGGNNQTGFGKIYLGDKDDQNGGLNSRYTIDVESTTNDDRVAEIPYRLRCQSGSGHTSYDLINDNAPEDLF